MSELPAGWVQASLADLGGLVGGKTPSKAVADYWLDGSIFWTSPKDMKSFAISSTEDLISDSAVYKGGMQVLPKNTVLMVVRSGILAHTFPIAITNVETAINQDIKALKPNEAFSSKYVAYVLKSCEKQILDSCTKDGTTVASVSTSLLERLTIPLAPLAEQKRIADKLDALLARVDACRRRLDRVPQLIKRFRQAVLAAATAGDLTADWRESNNVGESSEVKLLKELVKIDVGFAFKSSEYINNGVRLLRGDNIEPGKLRWQDAKCFDSEKLHSFQHLMLNEGDVILAMDRPLISTGLKLARVRRDDLPCVLVQRVCRFRQNPAIDSSYLYFTLSDQKFIEYLREEQNGTQIPHISGTQILGFPIPIRLLEEQHEIVRRVEMLFAFADRLEARYTAARKQVDQLTPALLAKAFRGELVPQDPNDEPASALLERIRAERAGQGTLFEGAPKRRRKSS